MSRIETYTTAEVFEYLSLNRDREFIRLSDGLKIKVNNHGFYSWDSGHQHMSVDDEWEELFPKMNENEFKNYLAIRLDNINRDLIKIEANSSYARDLVIKKTLLKDLWLGFTGREWRD